jgi:hypothetical protein
MTSEDGMTMLDAPDRRSPAPRTTRIRFAAALLVAIAAGLTPAWSATAAAQASPSPSGAPAESLPPPPASEPPGPGGDAGAGAWEYRTLFVTWDSATLNWVADFSDGTRIEGLDAILNNEGRFGWELVAVVPELWQEVVDDAIKEDARRLRLFLKKPLG